MPELRLTKTRDSLPEGYQFGDARPTYGEGMTLRHYMRAEMEDMRRAAARRDAGMIQRLAAVILAETGLPLSEVSRIAPSIAQHWDVIEGDHA